MPELLWIKLFISFFGIIWRKSRRKVLLVICKNHSLIVLWFNCACLDHSFKHKWNHLSKRNNISLILLSFFKFSSIQERKQIKTHERKSTHHYFSCLIQLHLLKENKMKNEEKKKIKMYISKKKREKESARA